MTVFHQVLELTTPYFENSTKAEQFLARQCKAHLNREPQDLGTNDLWNLANWAMVSGGLMIGKDKAVELSDKIRNLRKTMNPVGG